MRSSHKTHGITPISQQFHVSHTIPTTFISNIQISCKFSTNNQKFHLILMPHTNHSSHSQTIHAYIHTLGFKRNGSNKTINQSITEHNTFLYQFSPKLRVLA